MLKCEKKYFAYVLLLLLLGASCHTYKPGITGVYKSMTYNRMQQAYLMLLRHETYVLNSSMIIRNDSSYVLTNCANIESGHWQLRHDSLMLYCQANRYKIDSLNITGYNGRFLDCGDGKPMVFRVENGKLKQRYRTAGNRTVLYYFKKQN